MLKKIYKCSKCNVYTLKQTCPECGGEVFDPRPAKFSPEDKYGKYRRLAKNEL
jgi:H/ACA ribonucleoprotein complex subunit 3